MSEMRGSGPPGFRLDCDQTEPPSYLSIGSGVSYEGHGGRACFGTYESKGEKGSIRVKPDEAEGCELPDPENPQVLPNKKIIPITKSFEWKQKDGALTSTEDVALELIVS